MLLQVTIIVRAQEIFLNMFLVIKMMFKSFLLNQVEFKKQNDKFMNINLFEEHFKDINPGDFEAIYEKTNYFSSVLQWKNTCKAGLI